MGTKETSYKRRERRGGLELLLEQDPLSWLHAVFSARSGVWYEPAFPFLAWTSFSSRSSALFSSLQPFSLCKFSLFQFVRQKFLEAPFLLASLMPHCPSFTPDFLASLLRLLCMHIFLWEAFENIPWVCGQLQMIGWEVNRRYSHTGAGKPAKTNCTS